jgi:hypothetical protein
MKNEMKFQYPFSQAFSALKQHWKLVLVLSLFSAGAGVYTEVVASSVRLAPGSFHGLHLHAAWASEGPRSQDWVSANLWAQQNFLLPFTEEDNLFQGQRTAIVAANVSSADWNTRTVSQVWAFAPIADDALFADRELRTGGVEATVPARAQTWNSEAQDWRSDHDVRLEVALVLQNQGPVARERQSDWHQDPLSGRISHWDYDGRMGLNARVVGELSITDGTSNTLLISDQNATTWGELGDVRFGTFATTWDRDTRF